MTKPVLNGYQLDEYRKMFALLDTDLAGRILEFNSGLNAVNAQLYTQHHSMVSCDPLFQLSSLDLAKEMKKRSDIAINNLKHAITSYNFTDYDGIDNLINRRLGGIAEALSDYEQGRLDSRYISIEGNELPFDDFSFDLALSAHHFFTDAAQKDLNFHLHHIMMLAQTAKEVRIYPLVDTEGMLSPLIGPVLLGLQQENYGVEIREVDYRLQCGSYAMLRVWARACPV